MTTSNAWIVLGHCGDYYCEGVHPIGIYTTHMKAEEAAEAARRAQHAYRNHKEPRKRFQDWDGVTVETIGLDVMPVEFTERGT